MKLSRSLVVLIGFALSSPIVAQVTGRVVDDIDIVERSGYVDVNLLFTCRLRYIGHLPSSEGDSLRIRMAPQPDCALGTGSPAPPLVPTNKHTYIQGIDLDLPVASELHINIRWSQVEKFLVMPSGDEHSVRIRLLRPGEQRGRVMVGGEVAGRSAAYAINLESSHEPFSEDAIAAAAKATGVRAYVNELIVDQEKWYRLRIGPFVAEGDARRTLLAVRSSYPKAWLAIGDDEVLNRDSNTQVVTQAIEPRRNETQPLAESDIATTLQQAKTAFRAKDYDKAIPLLQKLLEQPEFPARSEAQELMGLARERNRQIAHAKAEYEEYLRRYPNGSAANRVRQRLHALDLAARRAVPGLANDANDSPWRIYGSFAQYYRRDNSSFSSAQDSSSVVSQNSLLNDFAFVARRHGERYDFSSRVGVSYIKNFVDNGLGDQTRISAALAEVSDRQLGWRARLGRQSVSGSGVYGSFDGIYADYQATAKLRVNLSTGAPVELTSNAYDSNRRFVAAALNMGPYLDAWDFATYAIAQQYRGETDRRALGSEIHYFAPGRTFIGLVDYDFYYRELNNTLMIGTLDLPARWTLNVNYDRRNSPIMSVRNALIGQTTTSLEELLAANSRDTIDQWARDRTSISQLYSTSLTHPVGEHWLWTFDASRTSLGATAESGGVPPTEATPAQWTYSVLGIGNSVFGNGDLSVCQLRYQDGDTIKTSSVGLSSRWPLWNAWRLDSRLRVDRSLVLFNDSVQWTYAPSLRLDYQRSRALFEFEVGTEIGKVDVGAVQQKTTRTYFSLGYRINL